MLIAACSSQDFAFCWRATVKAARNRPSRSPRLTGVMEGLLTFNAKLATDGKPKLFCLPPKKEMTTHQAAEIMMHQAKDVPDADNYPISILLLAGLTDTFRCEEQTRRVVRPGVEPAEQQPRQAIHRKHRGDTSKQPTGHPRKARP